MSQNASSNRPPVKAGILIASDRAADGTRPDETLPLLARHLETIGVKIVASIVLPDDKDRIVSTLHEWSQSEIDLILTSGGTGLSPRDVTPEATINVIDKRIPGIEEAMRQASSQHTPFAMLSRAVAGLAGSTLIVNLPGKPTAAIENLAALEPVLSHAIELSRGGNPHE